MTFEEMDKYRRKFASNSIRLMKQPLNDGMSNEELAEITLEVNQCLIKHELATDNKFSSCDFGVNALIPGVKTISEKTACIADLILNKYCPLNPEQEYHHFTNLKAFESIIANKKIRLASVAKRFKEQEYLPFYKAHGMCGYKSQKDETGKPLGKSICENSFYISFTNNCLDSQQEDYMWKEFANKGSGVRLVFKSCSDKGELRKMYYPPDENKTCIEPLRELICIASKKNKRFVPKGLSRMGFFYLPAKYRKEQEYRLLIRKESCNCLSLSIHYQKTCCFKGYEYIEIPLNDNSFPIYLKLEKVITGRKANKREIREIIESSGLTEIEVL